ncbi:hypothetical protein, partial [Staphylococcus aureus]
AYFKVHKPLYSCASSSTIRTSDFDLIKKIKDKISILTTVKDISSRCMVIGNNEKDELTVLQLMNEMAH